jgi:hypothetical protein
MRRFLSFVIVGLVLDWLAACASTPAGISDVEPRFATARSHQSLIQVYRDASHACSDALVRVLIDGEHAGDVGPDATLTLHTAPGMHIVLVSPNARCPKESAQLYVTVADGQTLPLVTRFDFFGHIAVAPPDAGALSGH